MNIMNNFHMPTPVNITGRTSSITNSFVIGINPSIPPTEQELKTCLDILQLDSKDLRCAYCGDKSTEWDHLRPIVSGKRPTGYISNIYNLVPACGKCNQSKGNKPWREWILSDAPRSPNNRGIKDLKEKIRRLEEFENWRQVLPVDFQSMVGKELWDRHWDNCEKIHSMMKEAQELAKLVKEKIESNFR